MLYLFPQSNVDILILHRPKKDCNQCIKNNGRFVREISIRLSPIQCDIEFTLHHQLCEYHNILNFLRSTDMIHYHLEN